MKIFISVDMEGITGVTCWDDVDHTKPSYQRFRRVMTAEVNAAVEGALAAGASAVLVNDSHGGMRNVLIEELHPKADLISGSPKPLGMMCGVDSDVDLAFLIGYHAKAGTSQAILDHTWSSSKLYTLYLNGQEVGETGLNAAIAGHFGVPIALLTGDQAVTAEAKALLGDNLQTVAVKHALSRYSARSRSLEDVYGHIRSAAEVAMSEPHPKPLVLEDPITVGIEFVTSVQADLVCSIFPETRRVSGRRVERTAEDMVGAFNLMVSMLV